MNYVTGNLIKDLRENKGLTQKELAENLGVSDKAVSKWETNRGLPDISIIEDLAKALGISLAELLTGDLKTNGNISGNVKKRCFMYARFAEILLLHSVKVLSVAAVFYCRRLKPKKLVIFTL